MKNQSATLEAVFAIVPTSEMAKALGITLQGVCDWKRVPKHRVSEVSRLTGLPRYVLRPDIFGVDPAMVFAAHRRGSELGVEIDPKVIQEILVAALHCSRAGDAIPGFMQGKVAP